MLPPPRISSLAGRVVQRVVRRGLQRGLVEPGGGEDPADALDVERLPGVRGAGQRQQLRRQVEPGAQHAERLDRLVARARQDRRVDRRPTDQSTVAVGVQRDHRAVVVALHEPGADDLGDDTGADMARQASELGRLAG